MHALHGEWLHVAQHLWRSYVEALPLLAPYIAYKGERAGKASTAILGAILGIHLGSIFHYVIPRFHEAKQVQVGMEVQRLRKHFP